MQERAEGGVAKERTTGIQVPPGARGREVDEDVLATEAVRHRDSAGEQPKHAWRAEEQRGSRTPNMDCGTPSFALQQRPFSTVIIDVEGNENCGYLELLTNHDAQR
ncbi:hypothetical protein MMC17_008180 [Xylographa soralifera]|nr:hypothetical protein [Xylographa soralifera]